jgi:alpha-D-xyloside xylohydrolase
MQIEADLTLESSNNENHVPVPLVIGTRGWGVFVKSRYPGVFDVAGQSATHLDVAYGTGAASDLGIEVHLFSADKPLDVLRSYHEAAGFPGIPAEWAYGPLLWRDETTDQAQVLDDIQQIRTRDLATSGIWFDRPYASGVNTFDWSPTKFPAPMTMLSALHAAGLRYGIWHAPYVADADNDQDPAPAQHDFAEANGFFPPQTGVLVNQWGKPIDFTNPDAYAWWQQNLRTYTDTYGVEGYKLDYGEDIVLGLAGGRVPWRFADGSDERTMHYDYTMLYHRVYRETLSSDAAFLLTRTGRWGDQVRGMIIWPGDLAADLSRVGDAIAGESTKSVGGLPTALAFGIGLSASGFPFYASDTGGYRRSPPNKETWVRWVEANAVWPAMQVGDSSAEMPWEFTAQNGRDAEALDIYRRYARLHMRLFPYVWSYAAQIIVTGHPIVRPFGLAYPELGRHPADQYLLGEHLFVAPVIAAGATTRTFVLPPGTWLDWWTGEALTGAGDRTVDVALDTLPLYLARGGIVPMLRDTIDTLAHVSDAGIESFANDGGVLFVRVAPGPTPTSFTLFDGAVITQDAMATTLTFDRDDESMLQPRFDDGVLFEVIGVAAAPAAVNIAGSTALTQRNSYTQVLLSQEGWFWDSASTGGTLWIKVPGEATITVQP